jgi:hypothetical protein
VSTLHVRQIAAAIERDYAAHVDLTDVAEANKANALLTRGLAALAVQMLTGRDPAAAAITIVDGWEDNGIDAICVEELEPRIILVQSKWRHNGRGGIDYGDTLKFIEGLKALTNEQFQRFNEKVQPFAAQLTAALRDSRLRIVVAVVTTGASTLGQAAQQALDDVRNQINDPTELLELKVFGLADVHRFLAEGASGTAIDLDVVLENWGLITEPYQAFYGTASAAQVAAWYGAHGDRLFDGNIRRGLGATPANRSIVDTLRSQGQHFWYFNNGITVLCEDIRKTAVGSAQRSYGQFALRGVTVVNGAQTVASIAEAARADPACVEHAQVWVRLISLTDCPAGFGVQVTRATNTQNTVEARDFVALDPLQSRLREDFALTLGKRYTVKRGEDEPTGEDGCSVVEAADALACARNDPSYAVIAKSRRGQLLESGESYYSHLFTRDLAARDVWHRVLVLRAVDTELENWQRSLTDRAKAVAVQGNRVVAHLVFQALTPADGDWTGVLDRVPVVTVDMLGRVLDQVEWMFPESYITSLFKNTTKCRQIATAVRAQLIAKAASPPGA